MADDPELRRLLGDGPFHPDREFVRGGATFGEVYEMAGWLREVFSRENPDNEPVCLAAEDKAVMAAALLAALAGGPLLLLPFAFSGRALVEMQRDCRYSLAIADGAREFPPGVRMVLPRSGGPSARLVINDLDLQAPLLRLFTGGSTGAPVSWLKSAGNLFGEALYLAERYRINHNDLLVATVSPYHIYGLLLSVLVPLVSGAAVLADAPSFPVEIRSAVRDTGATILAAVPAHYRVLRGGAMGGDRLRLAFSSAGMLDEGDNADFCRQNKVEIVEVYGSTETGGIATRNRARGESGFYPFAPVDWRVGNEKLLVRSAFISTDAARDENGYFAIADRVEPGPDNSFFLRGRADTITKVGGKRVDLDEVRDKIKSRSGVEDCVVISLAAPGGRENMIAALVQGREIRPGELRQDLAALLESYAMPRLLRTTEKIPLTANGKYDTAAIRQFFA